MARTPPRFVPTLTEVVGPSGRAKGQLASAGEPLVHRIMQRVELTLERRLREAIATVVLEQTRTMAPMLRDEIESVVRQAVSEALAEELKNGKVSG
ncbi:MAG TPA: hypothetical protein VLJ58_17065 [Ramlibacter sp.]|nr:hypothetical protein [Ramlibacter sp.]